MSKTGLRFWDKPKKKYDNDTKFIFGHAGDGYDVVGGKNDIKAFQNYLSRLLDTVNSAIKSGKSQEEIMKIQAIPGADEWKGDGIDRSLSATYTELMTK